jgi:type II secretory pathway component PulJ
MTNEQLYLAIGVPSLINIALITLLYVSLSRQIDQSANSLKEIWRAELRRVEEVLDARLKHLEER